MMLLAQLELNNLFKKFKTIDEKLALSMMQKRHHVDKETAQKLLAEFEKENLLITKNHKGGRWFMPKWF